MELRVLGFSLVLLLSASPALAGASTAKALCERLLEKKQIAARERELVQNFFGRPFVIFDVLPMTAAGKFKFGFPVDVNDRDLHNLVFISAPADDRDSLQIRLGLFRGFKFVTLLEYGFPEPRLTGWEPLTLKKSQSSFPYETLIQEFPASDKNDYPKMAGYHSAPDPDGIRSFISYSDEASGGITGLVILGIDVPCEEAATYTSSGLEFVEPLHTPEGNFCRLSFLTFARTD